MLTIDSLTPSESPDFFKNYFKSIPAGASLFELLQSTLQQMESLIRPLNETQLNHRYAPDKWSIKEIVNHLTDAERVFAYRAMCFARKDPTELPGFDENNYVPNSKAASRSVESLLQELIAVRHATIELFKNFDDETLMLSGIANRKRTSVRAIGFIIVGHMLHHMNVIHERYLKG